MLTIEQLTLWLVVLTAMLTGVAVWTAVIQLKMAKYDGDRRVDEVIAAKSAILEITEVCSEQKHGGGLMSESITTTRSELAIKNTGRYQATVTRLSIDGVDSAASPYLDFDKWQNFVIAPGATWKTKLCYYYDTPPVGTVELWYMDGREQEQSTHTRWRIKN